MAERPQRETDYFEREFINQLTQRIDGPAFLSRFIKVETRGNRHFTVCPFHKDSKPSCLVRNDGSFYCFGCHKTGSIFRFLMEKNGLRFPQAVREVAQFIGVPIPKRTGKSEPTEEQQALYDLLEKCASYFKQQLRKASDNSTVKRYLSERGIDQTSIDKYQIGFAIDNWTAVKDHFKDTNEELLIGADMLVRNDEKKRVYDRFRNRLMFPIRNRQGYFVGFGGRVVEEGVDPKYLNTKQTKVFSKTNELYGLYESLGVNSRPPRLLLVEGYMDVVALSQYGIPYAVAALGTASNAAHFRTMFWFADEVICCFDGDDAGRTAAKRALEAALEAISERKTVRFMFLPEGEDPDSLVRTQGKEAFERRIGAAQHVADYFVETLVENKGRSFPSIEQKARFVDRATALINKVKQPSMRKILAQEVARCFPDNVDLAPLLAPPATSKTWLSSPAVDDSMPPLDATDFDEGYAFETVRKPSLHYFNEINTRRRISHLLCAPTIWGKLKLHHDLLERLVDIAPEEPLTRVWLTIDRHHFSTVSGLVASFQDDEWFSSYLADIHDPRITDAMSDSEDTLRNFLDGVDTFITTRENQVEQEAQLVILSGDCAKDAD